MSLPSVTTIIKPWGPDFSHVKDLDFYAARGTALHSACTAHVQGLWCPVDDGIKGYFDSFLRWYELVDDVIMVQRRLISKVWGYTGEPDIVVTLKNDPRLVLADFKSPLAYSRGWSLQTAGYVVLFEENVTDGIKIDRWGSLRLREDGGVAIFNEADPGSKAAFLCALRVYKYMMDGKKNGKDCESV